MTRKLTLVSEGASSAAATAREDLEDLLIMSGYLYGGPFSSLNVNVVFGDHDVEESTFAIEASGVLRLVIEVDEQRFARDDSQAVRDATLRALIHAGNRYGRPTAELEAALAG